MSAVLLLNTNFEPLKVIPWQKAIQLVLEEKADILKGYTNQFIRSMMLVYERPAVVVLRQYVRVRTKVKLSRRNVLARDNHVCAFCGWAPVSKGGSPNITELTIDHIIPKSRAVNGKVKVGDQQVPVTSWVNLITACFRCNTLKGARTPEEAGMRLRFQPKKPSAWDALKISMTRVSIPEEWREHLGPLSQDWGRYWDVALTD